MGRRKISFDPAASTLGLPWLMAIKVSLCGPHSLETSTFAPTLSDDPGPAGLSAGWFSRYWYLFHQVGLCELLFCAVAGARIRKSRKEETASFMAGPHN